jgi:hypothetical protein
MKEEEGGCFDCVGLREVVAGSNGEEGRKVAGKTGSVRSMT